MPTKVAAALLAVLCLSAAALPAAAGETVIGIVYPECCDAYDTAVKSLKTELARGGYGAGVAEIYEQKPSADPASWTNAFRKFVGVDADLIIILGDNMLDIACREKTKVPVLFGFSADPGRARCVKSEERPGSNVTGVSSGTPLFTLLEKAGKVKKFSTLGVFSLAGDSVSVSTLKEVRSLEGDLGFKTVPLEAASREELAGALESAPPLDLLLLPTFAAGIDVGSAILTAAAARRLPTVSQRSPGLGSFVLVSLYADPEEQGRLMGQMALRLLEGAPPGKMSVETPKKIELEVNVGLARELNLKIPMAVLESATKVTK